MLNISERVQFTDIMHAVYNLSGELCVHTISHEMLTRKVNSSFLARACYSNFLIIQEFVLAVNKSNNVSCWTIENWKIFVQRVILSISKIPFFGKKKRKHRWNLTVRDGKWSWHHNRVMHIIRGGSQISRFLNSFQAQSGSPASQHATQPAGGVAYNEY